ncbi:MAG TPA: SDR family oxidoreductase [Steroidobacteraceae bacterium]|nr:SDR family oxidoreductase [Steroidobacteraceae bacterium]
MSWSRVCSLLVVVALILPIVPVQADTVLITGANSGIGLEFAKQYAARHWTVIATHRHAQPPDTLKELATKYPNIRIETLDVTSPAQAEALAAKLHDVPIDVLINNAGVYAESDGDASTQNFGHFNFTLMDTILAVNVKGPLIVSQSFYPNILLGHQKKIISISSTTGQLTQPSPDTIGLFYRASKAALNREMQLLAQVLRPRGITVVLLHPGTVHTERFYEHIGKFKDLKLSDAGTLAPSFSVGRMIATIDRVTLKDSGRFLLYDGSPLPW